MKSVFWAVTLCLGSLVQTKALADTPSAADNKPVIFQQWKLDRVDIRGGDFWSGYTKQVADLQRSTLEGTWDRRKPGGNIVTFRKTRPLEKSEQQQISHYLYALERSPVAASECGIIADGPEEFLDVHFKDEAHVARKLRIVAEDRRVFVCGDRYVNPPSLEKLVRYVNALLPAPQPSP